MFEFLLLSQPPRNPSSSTTARKFPTILGRIGSWLPASHAPEPVSTSEGAGLSTEAAGAPQSSHGRRRRPELLPGERRLRRRKSPPDAAGVRAAAAPPAPARAAPATAPAAEAAAAVLCSRVRRSRPRLAPQRVGSPLLASRRSPSLSASSTSPEPGGPVAPGHGVRSHSETDSGFRPAAEPGVPEEEAMCAIVGAHLGRHLPVGGRDHRCLLFGRGRFTAEVSPNGAVPLRRRLLPPHHRTNSVQHKTRV